MSAKLKDNNVVEIEIFTRIADRTMQWYKMLGFFLGIPVVMILAIWSFLGVKTYNNISNATERVTELTHRLSGPEAQLKQLAAQVGSDMNAAKLLDTQLSDVLTTQRAMEARLTSVVVVNEIRNWLFPDLATLSSERSKILREWMNKKGLDDESLASLLNQPAFDAARKQVIKELNIPPF